jgi:hypothetical protein
MASPYANHSRMNFRPGDRLYGLRKPRLPELHALERGIAEPERDSDVTMDRVNDRLGLSFPNKAWRMPGPSAIPHATDRAFASFLMGKEGERGKSIEGPDDNARIRRATKLGTDFTIGGGGTVHFMLDKVKMEDVVGKRNRTPGWKDVTGSELRYLYRNKDTLGHGVRFYKDGAQAEAPWQAQPELWAKYEPKKTKHHWDDRSDSDVDSMASNNGSVGRLEDFSDEGSRSPSPSRSRSRSPVSSRSPSRSPSPSPSPSRRTSASLPRPPVRDKSTGCRCSIQ